MTISCNNPTSACPIIYNNSSQSTDLYFLTWPKQGTATSRTTERKQFAVCTAKSWDRDRTDERKKTSAF